MQRTKIEWVRNLDGSQGCTLNPVKGKCPVACPYCYARRLYDRFKWNPTVRYDPRAWLGLGSLRKPSRIFVGSTIELFDDRLSEQYLKWILEVPLKFPQHTFIFLTKQPQNLIKWSPFPENCWVGVTATDAKMTWYAMKHLKNIQAQIKFISLEPLLEAILNDSAWPLLSSLQNCGINWLIIGAQTNPYKPPEMSWVREIVEAADRAGIPVFLKDNLKPLLVSQGGIQQNIFWKDKRDAQGFEELHLELRQEMPEILYCSTCRVRRR